MPTIGIAKRISAIGIIAVDLDPLVDIQMDMTLHGRFCSQKLVNPRLDLVDVAVRLHWFTKSRLFTSVGSNPVCGFGVRDFWRVRVGS